MKFRKHTLEDCAQAEDIVVAIDVVRAFTCAALAFERGAGRILLTGAVEEAFQLKQRFPSARMMGELKGLKIPGFDYGNSPTELARQDLQGLDLIQRTSAGTQGVVRSTNARMILAASFCCAQGTARYLANFPDGTVSFVITGRTGEGHGDEDEACADYLEALLRGGSPDPQPYLRRVRESKTAARFVDGEEGPFPATDIGYCLALDRFPSAMQVEKRDGLNILRPVRP